MRTQRLVLALILLLLSGCTVERTLVTAQHGAATAWSRPLDDQPLEQSFLIPSGGADEVELVAALPPNGQPPASLLWSLLGSGTRTVLADGEIESAMLTNNSPVRLPLPPLEERQSVILTVSASGPSAMRLWISADDLYPEGMLTNNGLQSEGDLLMTLRAREGPGALPQRLAEAAARWPRVPVWLLLMATAPGWLAAWLLGRHRTRPLGPAAPAIGLALVPLMHALLSLLGQRVYDPLSRSLLITATLAALLAALRNPARLRALWRSRWAEALLLLLLAIALSVATWLLATRGFLAPPGEAALPSAIAARETMARGSIVASSGALPLASLSAVLGLISLSEPPQMMLLLGLLLGVALVPGLFALGGEVGRRPWIPLVLLPLAWLWPAPWQAMARGDLPALYSMALLPTAVALATRALGAPGRGWGPLALAALPLAGLALVQGPGAPLALGIATAVALWLRRVPTLDDPRLPSTLLVRRALLLLLATGATLLPAFWYSYATVPLSVAGYGLLAAALALALALRRVRRGGPLLAALALVALLPLAWWRSAPLVPEAPTLSESVERFMEQERKGGDPGITRSDGLFLVAMRREGSAWVAEEGTAWLPAHLARRTALQLQRPLALANPTLLERAMAPGALEEAALRAELRATGIRYVLLDSRGQSLTPDTFREKPWAQPLYHVGSTYLFEILP